MELKVGAMRAIALGSVVLLTCGVADAPAAQGITPEMFVYCNAQWRQHRDGSTTVKDTDFAAYVKDCFATYEQRAAASKANQPSFNCATAKSASARLICSDAELSR